MSVYLAGPSSDALARKRTAHVWMASLDVSDAVLDDLFTVLSADERSRASRFVFERDRRAHIAAHGLLRYLLSDYTALPPAGLRFMEGPRGKPALAEDAEGLEFNLSHTAGFACFGITRGAPIGVDVERIRPLDDLDTLARHNFAPSEVEELETLAGDCRVTGFFNCWTRKEAYVKAVGDGLSCPLDGFEVTLAPGAPARLRRIEHSEIAAAHWSLYAFSPVGGVLTAAAVRARNVTFEPGWIYSERSRIAR
jgi:4'-phosphopantetheinyl transferase